MAAIQEVNIPEHEKNDPCSKAEKKIEPSQALEIKEAAGQEEKSTTVQVRKSEWWPTPPKKRSDEDRIQKLEDLTVSQQEEMEKLRRQIEEAQVAMNRAREAAKELHIQVQKQKQTIKSRKVEVRHLRSETKKHKEEKEAALSELSKSEEENNELKGMIRSLNKEGCKVSQTLKVARGETESQTRELGEAQNKIAALHNEVAQLHNTVTNLENKVISLNFEKTNLEDVNVKQECGIDLRERIIKQVTSEMYSMAAGYEEQKVAMLSQISDYKVSMNDCKLSLKKAETKERKALAGYRFIKPHTGKYEVHQYYSKLSTRQTRLQKIEDENMLITKRLKDYKARSKRRSKIMRAEKETKEEMKKKIETLEKENEKLRRELNNGFIGSYRQMKRLFLRVADTLLFRTIY